MTTLVSNFLIILSLLMSVKLCAAQLGQAQFGSPRGEIQFSPAGATALSKLVDSKEVAVPADQPPSDVRASTPEAAVTSRVPRCLSRPSISDVTSYKDNAYLLDRNLAGKLSISWIGTGNADADSTSKVFVRELLKFATCPATDGSGDLLYGAFLRAAVLIDDSDLSGGVNFAVAAASATVKARRIQVKIESTGYLDNNIPTLTSTAQNLTASGLTVDNYAEFKKALNEAFDAAAKSGVASMQYIAFSPTANTIDLVMNVATTYALDQIAAGFGCNDAVNHFNKNLPNQKTAQTERTIRSTYESFAKSCDPARPIVRAAAVSILNGLKFRK